MPTLWRYLKPYCWLAALAGPAQVLAPAAPLISGKLIDEYATHPGQQTRSEQVAGVLRLLTLGIVVTQTLRLSYTACGDQSSGANPAILQKVRTDIETFTLVAQQGVYYLMWRQQIGERRTGVMALTD